jgi:ElaB/YqjD/DUF883 family membrane-anchored ribosome-binding protein
LTHDPYQGLVALARREHELALAGDAEALHELQRERAALIATLPASAPPSARPALIEAARIQERTTHVLEQARAQLSRELAAQDRSRQTAAGYTRALGPRRTRTITISV